MENNYFAHETAIIDEGCEIGDETKIWHFSPILSNCKIGEKWNIGQNVVISPEEVLGKNVKIQNNVSIYNRVTCDDDLFLGPSCVFTNVINTWSAINRKGTYEKTHIGEGASIGANATIVYGNNIGQYSFIGAGALVTKTVLDYALVDGNLSKHIDWMSEFGHKLIFNQNGEAIYPESNSLYLLKGELVKKVNP